MKTSTKLMPENATSTEFQRGVNACLAIIESAWRDETISDIHGKMDALLPDPMETNERSRHGVELFWMMGWQRLMNKRKPDNFDCSKAENMKVLLRSGKALRRMDRIILSSLLNQTK